jgi:energy-coupling factor transporter ATP-binding protein EcfA2
MVHLALTMAIDARLLVLDEPTLGLDILARRGFYDALVNDYMDETRTIVITTHQVEEVENLLTDVLFIDKGASFSIARSRTSRALCGRRGDRRSGRGGARRKALLRAPRMLGKTVLYFEGADRRSSPGSAKCTRRASPTCSSPSSRGGAHEHFMWLVRREFWENKAIWVLPALYRRCSSWCGAVRQGRQSPPCLNTRAKQQSDRPDGVLSPSAHLSSW